jgi:cell division septum initiation protein DivIVA
MPLDPEQIRLSGLPRDALGGYKAGPAEDLFERVGRAYRQLLDEHNKLRETADILRRRVDEANGELATFRERSERQRDPDETGRALLEAAQRMARHLRDEARRDSDAALRKARARARLIELEAQRRSGATMRARLLGIEVRRKLQATLEVILESPIESEASTPFGNPSAQSGNTVAPR